MIEFLKTSDEQRLRILNLLSERRLCVCVIEDVLKLKQSIISTYLAKLKRLNHINSEKSSKWIYYYKNIEPSLHSILQSVITNYKRVDIGKRDIDSLKYFPISCTYSKSIIITCTKNSCRSQIAEVVFKNFTNYKVFSAGINPSRTVNEDIKMFLEEKFSDDNLFPKHIDNFLDKKFDIAVFICKEAYNTHQYKIKADKILFWDIEDIDFENVPFEKFNKVYNEINV